MKPLGRIAPVIWMGLPVMLMMPRLQGPDGPTTVRLPAIVSTSKAVMLIKPQERTGPISISQAPTRSPDHPRPVASVTRHASTVEP